ncbi:MAG: MFS transporter [Chloroflexi bacterium AL-W]|nr:MFS transporter [Chloroflexi bacterium AL-N1]NOK66942.1 MFS transporter [Chloroflexi bacterium AL-N10]NOK74766.1 MFS transporter [Chloroflexi bacterium AL-N5]NOK81544.1 MFS transporter [Chloroflexi bacterium AL-W]NOK89014.1 MFS transporter [Chloroflexi bacterium AL-N15]
MQKDIFIVNTNNKNATPLFGLLSAEFLSLLGNQITAVAIPVLVLEYTHSPIAAGFAGAGAVLPIVFSALIGGRIIDTFGAVKSSFGADLMSFLSVLVLPLALIHFTDIPVITIFFLVFLGALFDPTGVTARQTMLPEPVRLSKRDLGQINGYRGALENGADLLGPAIRGLLIAIIGIVNTFFINAASFWACAMILYITVPDKTTLH